MVRHGGDDLEDDFIPDDLVAFFDVEDDEGHYLGAADGSFPFFDDGENYDGGDSEVATKAIGAGNVDKKRKRREKEKQKKSKKKKKLGGEPGAVDSESLSIAAQSPLVLANYLASIQAKALPELSSLELEDLRIPDTAITDTTSWTRPRTLDTLIDFIAQVIPTLHTRLSQRSKSFGAPTLLFVTGAAMRAADVTRIFKDKQVRGEKGGEVAKLFAKHFKLEEHVTYLKRTKVGVAVGTPGRIGKLFCDTDAFTLSALTHVILDVTFRDAKNRSLLDIPENRDEVFKTVLGCPRISKAVLASKVQIVLF